MRTLRGTASATRRYQMGARIRALDPVRDHEQIARLLVSCEFPFDVQRAMELAVLHTFGIPSIARVLVRSGKFLRDPGLREHDTQRLLDAIVYHGPSSRAGRSALEGVRAAHRGLPTDTDEMRYVLGTFVFEPLRWMDRYGWRRLTEGEREAAYQFWRAVGVALGISVPEGRARFEAFYEDFERRHMVFDPANLALTVAVLEHRLRKVPAPLKPLARQAAHALIDDRLRQALGLPPPPEWVRSAVEAALRLRAQTAAIVCRGRAPVIRPAGRPEHRPVPAFSV